MQHVVNTKHIRTQEVDAEKNEIQWKALPIWATKTGSHNCCSRAKRTSDFEKYGPGTVLYF